MRTAPERRGRQRRWLALAALGGATAVAGLVPTVGCGGSAAGDLRAEERGEPGEVAVFVFDRSTSIPDHQLELARELVGRRIRELDHGDRIAGLQVLQRSLAEPPKRWSQNVPEREWKDREMEQDSVNLARFLRDAQAYLRGFSDPDDREDINGTDLLSTFHDVAEEVRPFSDHRATLYLFSDMLQSEPEIEMEGLRKMPPEGWVEAMAAQGRLPDLSGVCVVAVGPRVDTEAGQKVKAFWKEYFGATGASLRDENYVYRPVRLPSRPCP